jgi:hypothetical protein
MARELKDFGLSKYSTRKKCDLHLQSVQEVGSYIHIHMISSINMWSHKQQAPSWSSWLHSLQTSLISASLDNEDVIASIKWFLDSKTWMHDHY